MQIEAGACRYRQPIEPADVVLGEEARHAVKVRKLRHVKRVERFALERDAAGPRVASTHTAQGRFREDVGMTILLGDRSEHVLVALQRAGHAAVEDQRAPEDVLVQASHVDPGGIDGLAVVDTLQLRRQRVADGASIAVLACEAHREPAAAGFPVLPEQARPENEACVSGEVVPAVVIDVVLQLVMQAGRESPAKLLRQAS